jgi:hypothetical protein
MKLRHCLWRAGFTQRRKGSKDAKKKAVDGKVEGRNFISGLLCVFAPFASLRETAFVSLQE